MHPRATAVVCGSDTSVGGALVDRLRTSGVTVIAIDFPGVSTAATALQFHGDLTEERDWIGLAADVRAHALTPSMLVYAIDATEQPTALGDLVQSEWDHVISRNLRGTYLACKHLLPLMHDPGAVVLLASVLAERDARADAAAMSASSGGILALTRSLALSCAPRGVRVNAVCYDAPLPPAWMSNDHARRRALGRIPLGRATSPQDVINAVLFLLSDDASYITGSSLVVDGGQTLQSWSNAPDDSYAS